MRSFFGALVVLGLSVALLAGRVLAEAPPELETRPVGPILAALKKKPGLEVPLATLRFYVEVLEGDSLDVPVGSEPETTWDVLDSAENALGLEACKPVGPRALRAASALLTEYGDKLPLTLRAWTLGQQGKKEQASDLLAGFIAAELRDPKKCPSEHPTSSYHRVARISAALGCISTFSPKRDLAKLKKVLERASACASNNMAEG